MARTKKQTTQVIEKVTQNPEEISERNIQNNINAKKNENIYPYVIANDNKTVFRRMPTLIPEYIIGTMPIYQSYKIESIVESKIYGEFYKLSNGYYITKQGNYTVKE